MLASHALLSGIRILTLDSQRKLIANRFTFGIDCTARVISGWVAGNLLQHQALIGPYHPGGGIVSNHNTLQKKAHWNVKVNRTQGSGSGGGGIF